MNYSFKNKTILISGGSSGLGLEIAKKFYGLDANVVICGRDKSKFENAKKYILNKQESKKANLFAYQCDMSIEKSVLNLLTFIKENGSVDILINNCSTWSSSSIIDLSIKDLDFLYENILKSTIVGTKVFSNEMKNNKNYNSIINICSFAAFMPQKNSSIYACLKAAVLNFTKSSASELAKYNIRVNSITPGVIETDMTRDYIKKNEKKLLRPISSKAFGHGDDIANGVAFLSSNNSKYINGENICITGGKYLTQE